jgi:hypothetical protein
VFSNWNKTQSVEQQFFRRRVGVDSQDAIVCATPVLTKLARHTRQKKRGTGLYREET